MYKVVQKNKLHYMIQHSNGEYVYEIRKTGWVGLKADLPEYAKKNKRLAIHEVIFGCYDKAEAVKLCEKLNKEDKKDL